MQQRLRSSDPSADAPEATATADTARSAEPEEEPSSLESLPKVTTSPVVAEDRKDVIVELPGNVTCAVDYGLGVPYEGMIGAVPNTEERGSFYWYVWTDGSDGSRIRNDLVMQYLRASLSLPAEDTPEAKEERDVAFLSATHFGGINRASMTDLTTEAPVRWAWNGTGGQIYDFATGASHPTVMTGFVYEDYVYAFYGLSGDEAPFPDAVWESFVRSIRVDGVPLIPAS